MTFSFARVFFAQRAQRFRRAARFIANQRPVRQIRQQTARAFGQRERRQRHCLVGADGTLRHRIKTANAVNFIAEKFQPQRMLVIRRVNIDDIAAYREFAATFHLFLTRVALRHQTREPCFPIPRVAQGNRRHLLGDI